MRAKFSPLDLLQSDKLKIGSSSKDFDAIWQFEIIGRKFEQVENPLKVGVLESGKCYFIVFYKQGKTAIALWRGKDQSFLDF